MSWEKAKKLFSVSIGKTLYFNLHYFGLKGIRLPVFVYKNMSLKKTMGKVCILEEKQTTGMIKLGVYLVGIIDKKYQRGVWSNSGQVIFERNCTIGAGTKIANMNTGTIVFGSGASITASAEIVCRKKITIGKEALISWDCLFLDTDFHRIIEKDGSHQNEDREITIGDSCWIGCRSVILKGASLESNTVVAANSTITRKIEQNNVIVGGNNKIIKEISGWQH